MRSTVSLDTSSTARAAVRAAFVGSAPEVVLSSQVSSARFGLVGLDQLRPDGFERYLNELEPDTELAVVFVVGGSAVSEEVRALRRRRRFQKTRVYVVGAHAGQAVPGWTDTLDVEDMLAASVFDGHGLLEAVELGLRAYHSLVGDPLYTDYYLDMTHNKIFDWFETTRWSWDEIKLEQLDPGLLRTDEIDLLTEGAIIEFGTLPGAHNFLREWEGEVSFSSWALMWGAEEARHSLVQARYLDQMGIRLRSKHALYKREPYPMGDTRAGTLMMNVDEFRQKELGRILG